MQLLDSSISILDTGVNDFPRMSKVLQTTRHFELISEPDLHNAQRSLVSEIRPEVDNLLSRVSNYLDKLERREQSLIAKCELNEGRLSQYNNEPSASRSRSVSRPGSRAGSRAPGSGGLAPLEELKVKQLRQKKERLSYAVDRLTMQAQQRERQLRMSMAAPHQFSL
ncbi:DASH complex subunit Spc19 [Neofusicoccum parvum]|uniref:DASH complex subunit SPC19 n=3 Tax=Neofusicoccum TaxID=407951 RepID=R1FY69_BOTPV|nr:putative mitotic spindle biogenesis protein [Neofusicoccum parvum UCRNP2]GME27542.1 DASH complex subunit Spc19 [Neofusicoccum parvum]GME64322.1 DASH complex subunit Spc19 [Neofusicoccum parvum]